MFVYLKFWAKRYRLPSLLRKQESSLRGSPVDCGFKHAAMTTASKTGMASFFCPVALVSSVIILFFCCTVAFGAAPVEYEKVDHPPKLEGVLARIQKDWVAQKRALAKATATTIWRGRYRRRKYHCGIGAAPRENCGKY